MLTGIDVSKWQGAIDWPAVAEAGASFAICKASQGKSHKDPTFVGNWTQARHRMIPGAYHFFGGSIAAKEANNFLSEVYKVWQPGEPGLFALDLEWPARDAAYFAEAREWVRIVSHDLKRPILIYTQASFWHACGDPEGFGDNPLWAAEHRNPPGKPPKLPKGWADWTLHQYTGSDEVPGSWPGITGNIDLNRLNPAVDLQTLAAGTASDIAEPRPELDANFIAELQTLLNRYAAQYGFEPLKPDGIRGPKTNAALALTPLGQINVRKVERRPITIEED